MPRKRKMQQESSSSSHTQPPKRVTRQSSKTNSNNSLDSKPVNETPAPPTEAPPTEAPSIETPQPNDVPMTENAHTTSTTSEQSDHSSEPMDTSSSDEAGNLTDAAMEHAMLGSAIRSNCTITLLYLIITYINTFSANTIVIRRSINALDSGEGVE